MAKRYFTVEEANALVPELRVILEHFQTRRRELEERQQTLEAIRQKAGGNGYRMASEEFLRLKREAEFFLEECNTAIKKIEALGCLLKDLHLGLIDFPSLRDGREVLLCWKSDEAEVAYWHDLTEGFAGRKPIRPHPFS
ncbi:MAG: DUF2203 domain-containing protein [Candidatus Methylomirabilales bacterium]